MEKLKKIFNEIEFLNSLSNADVTDKRIVEFLIQLDQPLFSSALNNLIFNYVEINKEEIFKIDLAIIKIIMLTRNIRLLIY